MPNKMYCPKCGTQSVLHFDVEEDNAGDLHICKHCGHSFFHTGTDYYSHHETQKYLASNRSRQEAIIE